MQAYIRQMQHSYKNVFRFNVSVNDIQWVKMFNCWANILGEADCELFTLSSIMVFLQEDFKIPSRHELHYDR